MDAISRLLKPRSVAVIGASADVTKTAGRPVSYLVKHGFTGKIFPVFSVSITHPSSVKNRIRSVFVKERSAGFKKFPFLP